MLESTTSVRISVKDGTLDLSGSEEFVSGMVKDPKKILALYQQLQVKLLEMESEKAEDYAKELQDRQKALRDNIKKLLELSQQVNASILR